MNLSPLLRGTAVLAYLLALAVALFVVLRRQGMSRREALGTVSISTWIFYMGLILSYQVADRLTLNGGDSLLIYLPPVFPVTVFAVWLLYRRRRIK